MAAAQAISKSAADARLLCEREPAKLDQMLETIAAEFVLGVIETRMKSCTATNWKLISAVLTQNKDVLLESEPLFGFKRVKIESLLEGYRDKLDEQKIHSNAFPQAQAQ